MKKIKFSSKMALLSDNQATEIKLTNDMKNKTPYFSFKNYSEKRYGLAELGNEDFKALICTLNTLSKLSWSEIEKSDRHKNGTEIIDRSCIKSTVPNCYEGKNIIAFRYKDKAPMLCVREGFCVDILFTDRDLTLYKHN